MSNTSEEEIKKLKSRIDKLEKEFEKLSKKVNSLENQASRQQIRNRKPY